MTGNQNTTAKARTPQHRRQIAAFVGILLSLMLLLSLLSYSALDQSSGEISFSDLWKVFSNDEGILLRAERTHNLLGLLGAIVSNWFINSTIGYAVIVVPFLGFIWSIYLVNRKKLHQKLVLSSYATILAILFAAFTGLLRQFDESLPMEWSGVVGHFIAYVLSEFIGVTGAILCVIAGFLILLTLLIDLDYKVTWIRFWDSAIAWTDWMSEFLQKWLARISSRRQDRS
jgi:S-DNA-T family DNA segregation ATPase FtsK/SpoIIIE